ncbi:unnamed protein product, partial [Amoebophrya sp. A120]
LEHARLSRDVEVDQQVQDAEKSAKIGGEQRVDRAVELLEKDLFFPYFLQRMHLVTDGSGKFH